MRVSVDELDGAYNVERNAKVLDIKLDGAFLARSSCITADEEQGKVLVYLMGEDNTPLRGAGGDFLTVWKHGRVEIVWRRHPKDRRSQAQQHQEERGR